MADMKIQGMPSGDADHQHEPNDVKVRAVVTPVGCLAMCIAGILIGAWLLLSYLDWKPKRPEVSLSPLAGRPQEPPPPHLQEYPPKDLAQFRSEENVTLTAYRWEDRGRGHVQIPVERAKDLLLQESANGTFREPGTRGALVNRPGAAAPATAPATGARPAKPPTGVQPGPAGPQGLRNGSRSATTKGGRP